VDNLGKSVSMVLRSVASRFPSLKHFVIHVDTHDYHAENDFTRADLALEDVVLLRFAADELCKMGLTFEVFRGRFEYEDEPTLSTKHGYTAPLPH
jgi:hypothetical protein